MTIGVISHLPNPDFPAVAALARAAEDAGADWLGLPDAFWWRDTWLLLAEAARATRRIALGPVVTNPYLRHPVPHRSGTRQPAGSGGPERVFVGIGAGGSEVPVPPGSRGRDAVERIRALVDADPQAWPRGEPLDPASGRTLDVSLQPPRVLDRRAG